MIGTVTTETGSVFGLEESGLILTFRVIFVLFQDAANQKSTDGGAPCLELPVELKNVEK